MKELGMRNPDIFQALSRSQIETEDKKKGQIKPKENESTVVKENSANVKD